MNRNIAIGQSNILLYNIVIHLDITLHTGEVSVKQEIIKVKCYSKAGQKGVDKYSVGYATENDMRQEADHFRQIQLWRAASNILEVPRE